MKKGSTVLKKYFRKAARVLALSGKLDPKKRAKAQQGFLKKVSPIILDQKKGFKDLTNALDYKEKFMKIAYPKVNLNEDEEVYIENFVKEKMNNIEELATQDPDQFEHIDKKNFLSGCIKLLLESPLLHLDLQEKLKNEENEEIEENKGNEKNEAENSQESDSGTYFWDGLQLQKKRESDDDESRDKTTYSNWYAGNVDPEDLHKHKEYLDRQYFGGPVWDGKEKPQSIMFDEELLEEYMTTLIQSDDDIDVRSLSKESSEKYNRDTDFQGVHR